MIASQATATGTNAPGATAVMDGWRDRIWHFVSGFRYSSYDDSDPLEHEGRAGIYERISDGTGPYLSALAEKMDMSLSAVRHHLRVLETEGLIVGAKVNGKRRYYPQEASGIELTAALDDEASAAVLRTLGRHGSMTGAELANALDRHPSTVAHHLKRLAESDLIERERTGRAVRNRLVAPVEAILESESHDGARAD